MFRRALVLHIQIGSTRIRTRAALAYALFKKGPLTSTGCDHGAFINTLSACTILKCQGNARLVSLGLD